MTAGCCSGPVGVKGVTGSPRFPHQLVGPWKHWEEQEEQGAQVITSNLFVRVSGALNIREDS